MKVSTSFSGHSGNPGGSLGLWRDEDDDALPQGCWYTALPLSPEPDAVYAMVLVDGRLVDDLAEPDGDGRYGSGVAVAAEASDADNRRW